MTQGGITRRATFAGIAAGLPAMASGSNVTAQGGPIETLHQLTLTPKTAGYIVCDGSLFIWTKGDFSKTSDKTNIIPSALPDAVDGAWVRQTDEKIMHRQSADAKMISVHEKLRSFVFADEDYGFNAKSSPRKNAIALQNAINYGQTVFLPSTVDPIVFDATIHIPPNTRLIGKGDATRLVCTADTAFVCEAPDGSGGNSAGPSLEHFDVFCAGNGIRLNRANGGFSDAEGQQALMRPRLDRVRIRRLQDKNGRSVGVEFNKCFDGVIIQCEIEGFATGYLGRGSDLIEICGRTRIWKCNTLIELTNIINHPYRYGSGTRIVGCDLLAARECYLRSSDMDLMVTDNYFEHSVENSTLSGWAFDIRALDRVRFSGNRVQLQATDFSQPPKPLVPKFLRVTTEPGNLFVWENNGNDGLNFGAVEWNAGAGQRYWINATQRSRIVQSGTSGTKPLEFPFNSSDIPQERPWRFSPSLPGLRNESYGGSVVCEGNAFVLPFSPDERHISFSPLDAPITGRVDVWVKAKSSATSSVLTLYNTDNGKFVSSHTQIIHDEWMWYDILRDFPVKNLLLYFLNRDARSNSKIYIGEVVIS